MSTSGRCQCGAVRYELTGFPLFAGFCYCEDCRRSTGSHSASLAVLESELNMTGTTRELTVIAVAGSRNPRQSIMAPEPPLSPPTSGPWRGYS